MVGIQKYLDLSDFGFSIPLSSPWLAKRAIALDWPLTEALIGIYTPRSSHQLDTVSDSSSLGRSHV